MRVIRWRKYTHELSTSFFEITEAHEGCKNKSKKNNDRSRFFFIEGWSIEGCVTKVVEQIVINVGLLILHKIKALFL